MSRATNSISMAALLLLQADVHHADLLRLIGGHRSFDISARPGTLIFLHQHNPVTSASPADQLRHVSWTEGFVSASQPLPASPCRCFIAHQAMGVRIESQFWESPFFGLPQQINQVLLILVFFLAWVYFSQGIITLVCSIICTHVCQMMAALTTVTWWFGNGLRLHHVVSSASRRRRPNRRKSARVITLLVESPYRDVRLPRGLRHR